MPVLFLAALSLGGPDRPCWTSPGEETKEVDISPAPSAWAGRAVGTAACERQLVNDSFAGREAWPLPCSALVLSDLVRSPSMILYGEDVTL